SSIELIRGGGTGNGNGDFILANEAGEFYIRYGGDENYATNLLTIMSNGNVFINDTANSGMTTGLTINQGAADNEIITLKSSDVAHGMTSNTETDTFGMLEKVNGVSGGLVILGFQDADNDANQGKAILMQGATVNAADTTKSAAARGQIHINGNLKTGTTFDAVGADGNLVTIANYSTTRFIFDAEGTGHADDVWTDNAYDLAEEYDISEFSEEGAILTIDTTINDRMAPATAIGQVPSGVISYHTAQLGSSFGNIREKYPQLNLRGKYDTPQPVALVGRVPVKVSTENGPIKIGDRITTSSLKGTGMRQTESGYSVGIALDSFDGENSTTTAIVNGQEVKTWRVLVFVNLGYAKLDATVQTLTDPTNVASNATAAWSVDQQSGKVNVTFFGDLNLNGNSIINVSKLLGANGQWQIDETGKLIIKEIETEKITIKNSDISKTGITIYDRVTGKPMCAYFASGILQHEEGGCGASATATTTTTSNVQ
ncbi:MAG: hypothetical protein HYW91_00805, partial [Candidatus Sungbacteria bacterium]|nr:hypothetical protein [Candidatus Sungbacteria bacterium]